MQPPHLEDHSPPSPAVQLRVGVDVGTTSHHVAIGLTDGRRLEEFEIAHTAAGFADFFRRIERHAKRLAAPVAVAMEGYNGHARPLDSLVRARGWQLFNVNNLKLARFKEIFPAAAKTDRIDTRKTLELFQLREHLPMAAGVLQEVMSTPAENDILKRLARRRRRLVEERGRLINALQADLRATAPGLLEITHFVGNRWFLNFLTCRKDIRTLARVQRASVAEAAGDRHRLRQAYPGVAADRLLRPGCRSGQRHDPPGRHPDPRAERPGGRPGRGDGAHRRQLGNRPPAGVDPRLRTGLQRRARRRNRHHRAVPQRGQPRALSRDGDARQ
jgi:hypothetical protein